MKWDLRFLGLAKHIAEWSKDPSTKVGAVITDKKNRIISLGFNGFPRGVKDDDTVSRERKLQSTIHAEMNALLFAKQDLEGATCYVTHPPCSQCAAKLIQAGITKIVFEEPSADFASRWWRDIAVSEQMYKEAGVNMSAILLPAPLQNTSVQQTPPVYQD